jgi:hypothetical protein
MTGAQMAAAARTQRTVIPRASRSDTWFGRVFRLLMFGAVGLAFLGLGAIIYDFAKDGASSPSGRASSRPSSGRST